MVAVKAISSLMMSLFSSPNPGKKVNLKILANPRDLTLTDPPFPVPSSSFSGPHAQLSNSWIKTAFKKSTQKIPNASPPDDARNVWKTTGYLLYEVTRYEFIPSISIEESVDDDISIDMLDEAVAVMSIIEELEVAVISMAMLEELEPPISIFVSLSGNCAQFFGP
ncbi:hypothetical protein OGAPHI_004767 [Ogataea philodendri]|uniref:Uncharacterized protein n=1 Tax=Ogataea philodendri TaxID=1378263 RepID=A0A9P8T2Q0_9ASCO|nr:uncharacterized protein OGAPHI_004767 [Ogataea philodendri]KAH3664053.1 hypothetical protein OGAPHI_004767 [Ogataea philodendri]